MDMGFKGRGDEEGGSAEGITTCRSAALGESLKMSRFSHSPKSTLSRLRYGKAGEDLPLVRWRRTLCEVGHLLQSFTYQLLVCSVLPQPISCCVHLRIHICGNEFEHTPVDRTAAEGETEVSGELAQR